MLTGKPIIGLAGGIGSGKSTVARMMASLGGRVIDADAAARAALQRPDIAEQLARWWGPAVLDEDGRVRRAAVAERVFDDPAQRERLEALIHPIVAADRQRELDAARADPAVRFIVLDVPLLYEVGLDRMCDRVVFVDASRDVRLRRVRRERGWDEAELDRREKNQWPVEKKRKSAHAIIDNSNSEDECLAQVRPLLESFLSDNR